MAIEIHPHARERMQSRGATETEVHETIAAGERFAAKHGRRCYRRNFSGEFLWRGKLFNVKQLEFYATMEEEVLVVVTVIVKYFSERSHEADL